VTHSFYRAMHFSEKGGIAIACCPSVRLEFVTIVSVLVLSIISGTGKARDFKFGRYIQRVHSNKSPFEVLEKGSMGISSDCPNF